MFIFEWNYLQALCVFVPLVDLSPETLNSGKNRPFYSSVNLKFKKRPWKRKGHILYSASSFCASFQIHWWIQTGFTARKRPILVKIDNLIVVWPWNLMDDLESQKGTSPKQHQTLGTVPLSYVNSNWSYGLETTKLSSDPCDLDLWPLTLTFCMDITSVIGNNSWKFHNDNTMMET